MKWDSRKIQDFQFELIKRIKNFKSLIIQRSNCIVEQIWNCVGWLWVPKEKKLESFFWLINKTLWSFMVKFYPEAALNRMFFLKLAFWFWRGPDIYNSMDGKTCVSMFAYSSVLKKWSLTAFSGTIEPIAFR